MYVCGGVDVLFLGELRVGETICRGGLVLVWKRLMFKLCILGWLMGFSGLMIN
jgi:hypothetical protein